MDEMSMMLEAPITDPVSTSVEEALLFEILRQVTEIKYLVERGGIRTQPTQSPETFSTMLDDAFFDFGD